MYFILDKLKVQYSWHNTRKRSVIIIIIFFLYFTGIVQERTDRYVQPLQNLQKLP